MGGADVRSRSEVMYARAWSPRDPASLLSFPRAPGPLLREFSDLSDSTVASKIARPLASLRPCRLLLEGVQSARTRGCQASPWLLQLSSRYWHVPFAPTPCPRHSRPSGPSFVARVRSVQSGVACIMAPVCCRSRPRQSHASRSSQTHLPPPRIFITQVSLDYIGLLAVVWVRPNCCAVCACDHKVNT